MNLTIPDEVAKQLGLTEKELLVELACRLFDADRLFLPDAARMAGLERPEFEGELKRRGIAAYRPTVEEFEQDLATLKRLDEREVIARRKGA
jgi:predicted HTH domain antitoxin